MRRALRAVIAASTILTTLAACEPTGDLRCDAHVDILDEVESHGWSTDCAPDFDNVAGSGQRKGETIWGWADQTTQTVYAWPDAITADNDRIDVERGDGIGEWHVRDDYMRWLLWHELAHVTGIADEADADAYAHCREDLGFGRGPSDKTCAELGA